ncbi:FimV/HubP family polar landmark protein [Neptunomonas japonica]|uniref:FimV domain-containing protein n=1 Tax=Neptunomonas japonica JAMM 1380 TaxID=1441457 RepID=A0A7R6PJJ8_9GAMM|nr:FimV/HubP family polar landmark protein [Neptunomonas japonica]BBB29426.1 FimV domain-containing protein [Neptunomonas japonica JAMM 1380]
MLRKLALSLAVAGALVSTQANALGLGDIKIKSALNEPLSAEIQLHQIRDLNPLQIRPRMADQDEFALAGLSQQRALSDIRFQVKVSPNGSGVILLTSREPVKEPFINFLVEVNWPSGRLVREYTLLLDPPVFDPSPTQKFVEPAVSSSVDTRSSIQAKTPVPRRAKANSSNIRTRMDKKTQAYVDVKDTLWGLALDNRIAPDISSYQMMVAMHKKNPLAFPDGNINNLKAGVVLNLPTEAEARAISSKQAAAEVHRQTALWKQGKAPAPDKAPIDGSKKSLKSEAADSQEPDEANSGQLKVVTPAEAVSKDEAAVDDQSVQTEDLEKQQLIEKNESLENQLAVSMESLDRLERDNVDLNDKLDAIQQQLDSLQRLIELKDQQLAALQTEVNKPPAPVVAPPPPPEKSLIDKILQAPEYLAGIGGGLIAVLVGLWLMLRRKKKAEEAVEEEEFFNAVDVQDDSAIDEEDSLAELEEVSDDLAEAAAEEALEERSENVASSEFDLDDDLDDLNLDMDLDLDDSFEEDLDVMAIDDAVTASEQPEPETTDGLDDDDLLGSILDDNESDDEFDLGLDELADMDSATELDSVEPKSAESPDLEDEFELGDLPGSALAADTALDELLADDDDELDALEQSRQSNVRSGMDAVDPISDTDDVDDSLESLASLGLDQLDEEPVTIADDEVVSNEEELEFNLSDAEPESVESESAMKDLEDELDELDFELDDLDMADSAPEVEVEPTSNENDLDFETDLMADLDSLLENQDVQEEVPELEDLGDGELASLDEETLDNNSDLNDFGDLDDVLGLDDEETAEDAALSEQSASLSDAAELLDDPEELGLGVTEQEAPIDVAGFDLDDLSFDESDDELPGTPTDEEVTRELTSNIEHDLDAELDDELEALLNSTDNDIALEESSSEEEHSLDALGFLDGADEVETKLDLARAYIDMDDVEGARDILEEIAQEGNDSQKDEATELLGGLV